MMLDDIQQFQTVCLAAFQAAKSSDELEAVRITCLGRKGKLASILAGLPSVPEVDRPRVGVAVNEAKAGAEGAYAAASARIHDAEKHERLEREWLDVTLPAEKSQAGHLHLTTQAIDEITTIFSRLGFTRVRHPEVDWDYYAFESLNMPPDHPARDEWETFFVAGEGAKGEVMRGEKGKVVLTPHTSNGQVREMERGRLPIRMISIGKCYRRQASPRHSPMFHQFEGLLIDTNVTITELKGTIDYFVKHYFGADRAVRLRPYHFRFTEPSFEVDVTCSVCGGTGETNGEKCKLCKEGWLELGGAGMVHENVLKAGGLDPHVYSGFAFGFGIERTMIMRSGMNIDDIRVLYRNDLRFLRQF